jgi:hypothetical protein
MLIMYCSFSLSLYHPLLLVRKRPRIRYCIHRGDSELARREGGGQREENTTGNAWDISLIIIDG